MQNKNTTGMKTIFISYLIVSLIISGFLFIYSFYYIKAFSYLQEMQINYFTLGASMIIAVLSISSFIGLMRFKKWGRGIGIITSLIIAIAIIILTMLYILNPVTSHGEKQYFSNLEQIILPLLITAYYLFNFFYFVLSKKVGEVFS